MAKKGFSNIAVSTHVRCITVDTRQKKINLCKLVTVLFIEHEQIGQNVYKHTKLQQKCGLVQYIDQLQALYHTNRVWFSKTVFLVVTAHRIQL